MARSLGAAVICILILVSPGVSMAAVSWILIAHNRYLPSEPKNRAHPKAHVEEFLVPTDAPHGLVVCSLYRGVGTRARGRMRFDASLWRPDPEGSLARIGEVASLKRSLRDGDADVCPVAYLERAFTGDVVRLEITFTRGARKISFASEGIVIQSTVDPVGR